MGNLGTTQQLTGAEAGVPWISFHTFRHTAASMLFDSGKNIRQVSDWLGHSDPAFTPRTDVYLMDGGLADAEALDRQRGATLGQHKTRRHPQARTCPKWPKWRSRAGGASSRRQPQAPDRDGKEGVVGSSRTPGFLS